MKKSDPHPAGRADNPVLTGGATYAARRPTYPSSLARALADRCPRTSHALDVGCGSGQLSRLLARQFQRVTATEPSQTQIADTKPLPCLEYRCESAEAISVRERSIDLIATAQAAHWFDLDAFYDEVRRVAHADTKLALVCYGVPVMDGAVGQRLDAFYWQDVHDFWPAARRQVEQGYRSLAFPFKQAPLPTLAIERQWSLDDLVGYIYTWSAVKRAIAAGEDSRIKAFENDLTELWRTPHEARPIRWPIAGRFSHVHA